MINPCPEWLTFTDVKEGIQEDEDAEIGRIPVSKSIKLMPVLSNLADSRRIPEGVEYLSQTGGQTWEDFIEQVATRLHKVRAAGVVADWEEIDPGLSGELTDLMIFIADGLRARGLETWLCVTMDAGFGAYDFDRLAPHVDRFVALLHDENGECDPAGPLASQDWFDGWMKAISHSASPEVCQRTECRQGLWFLGGDRESTGSRGSLCVEHHESGNGGKADPARPIHPGGMRPLRSATEKL